MLPEQATKPAAFSVLSFLGGTGNEGTVATNTMAALVTATDTYFYVGGTTDSVDLPGTAGGAQTANGGGTFDAFASRIPLNGSAGAGFQSTYIGGAGQDRIGGIAYDTRADKLLVFGTTTGSFPTLDTVPASNYFDGVFGGGTYDIFVATVNGALTTKDYATYIGGSSNDYLGQTGALVGQGHVVYSQATGLTYLATTVHSSDLPTGVIGTPPGKDTNKSNGTNDTHFVVAFNINSFDFGDAPVSYENGTPAQEAISSTLRIGATVDAEATAAKQRERARRRQLYDRRRGRRRHAPAAAHHRFELLGHRLCAQQHRRDAYPARMDRFQPGRPLPGGRNGVGERGDERLPAERDAHLGVASADDRRTEFHAAAPDYRGAD